jgi:murein DD-endopeptidase MepM/ murein hydrolase activator NlpD
LPRRLSVILTVALMTCVGLAADLGWRAFTTRPRYAVAIEGRLIGTLRQPEEAKRALDTVLTQIPPDMKRLVDLESRLAIVPLHDRVQLSAATEIDIERALVRTLPDMAHAEAITVNGQDIVAVEDEPAAQAVKDRILAEYQETVLRDASTVEQLKFQETIAWRSKVVPKENVRSVDQAVSVLRHGTDRLVTYVVKDGDTGWDIARSYNVSTDQLARVNPDMDLETLQVGQALNVTFREPYIHTQSVAKRVVQESIPFTEAVEEDSSLWPWQYAVVTPGVAGSRQLTIREFRENGQVVKTEVLENKVLSTPKVQVVRQGTKQTPSLGTGSLVYPVAGVLTSDFGERWGSFHPGIDIAAPTGTPVLAADSGIVVFADWSGNYGNLLKVDHGGGRMVTWYGHFSRFAVSVGDKVDKGQVIGYVGNTGFSTGPHLHYEVHTNGDAVNPLDYYH